MKLGAVGSNCVDYYENLEGGNGLPRRRPGEHGGVRQRGWGPSAPM